MAEEIKARVIALSKDVATGEIHNILECYIAAERLKGVVIKKPNAVAELIRIAAKSLSLELGRPILK
ncbi:MAG: hypothetical protein WKF87_06660 [Chryseolinea sp.]